MEYIIDAVGNKNHTRQFNEIVEIQNLQYPSQTPPNTAFFIEYDTVNISGDPLTLFGYIFDNVTQQQVLGSYWEQSVSAGAQHPSSVHFQSGIASNFNGDIVVGHVVETCGGIINEADCISAGCEWYNNSCHAGQPPADNMLIIGLAAAAVSILVVVLVVTKRKK